MSDSKPVILLLDDEQEILNSLKRLLRKEYEVHAFDDGNVALESIEQISPHIIVSDMRMPNMDGATFLARAREVIPDAVRILLTGFSDAESTARAINEGGIDNYVNKPWNNDDLKQLLTQSLKQYHLERQVESLQADLLEKNALLQEMNEELENRVEQRTQQLNKSFNKLKLANKRQRALFQSVIDLINAVAQQRTGSDGKRLKRVASHARLIAAKVSEDKQLSTQVYLAAMLHELGKISLPDELLAMKEFEMDAVQRHQFHGHVTEGAKILGNISHLRTVSDIVGHIFEDFNGHGFPEKLAREEIPLGSRILRVVNDYDMLICGEKQSKALTPDLACDYLKKYGNVLYDRNVVDTYLEIVDLLPTEAVHDFDYCIATKDLEVGMVLAKDVTYSNDVVMLTEGTCLTEVQIEKLKFYEREHLCNLAIFVH